MDKTLEATTRARRAAAAAPAPPVDTAPLPSDGPASHAARQTRRMIDDPAGRLLYLDHFALKCAPFQITPNPEFFYGAGDRGHMLYALLYCLRQGKGITTLTGPAGTGKTMLARMLLSCAPKALDIVFIANPALRRADVVPVIADELGIDVTLVPPEQGLRLLQGALVERHAGGRRVVLVVDEAQAMGLDVLEEIRLLSDLESASHKLLQILLVGQDDLRATLGQPQQQALRERITQRFHLAPLAEDEVGAYLAYRMQCAGGSAQAFDPPAARMIARGSMGLIRRINILADKSLMATYVDNFPRVMRRHVELALNEAAFQAARGAGGTSAGPAAAGGKPNTLARLWRRYGLGRVGPE